MIKTSDVINIFEKVEFIAIIPFMRIVYTLVLLFITGYCEALTYCQPNPSNGVNGYTTANITLESLNVAGGASIFDFIPDTLNTLTCFLSPGVTYNIGISANNNHSANTYAAWLDWNNDTTFSSSEKLGEFVTTTAGQSGIITFTVPLTSISGKLRLRIRCSSSASINSCNDYLSGQTSDFTVTILSSHMEYNFYTGWDYSSTGGNYINSVWIGNLDNSNSGSASGPVYNDYSYMTENVISCTPQSITIETVAPSSVFNHSDVYVDYNNDCAFTLNELAVVLNTALGIQSVTGTFSLPALNGNRRLRIYFYTNAGLSEIEDYMVITSTSTSSVIPVAKISSDLFSNCSGSCSYIGCSGINSFKDISCGVPTNWNWSVPGATPNQSTQQNPSFTFSPGTYSVTLIASNANGSDTDVVSLVVKQPLSNFTLGNDTSLCSGGSLQLNAPVAGSPGDCFLYHWSTGELTSNITINAPGTYSVRFDTCTHSACPAIDTIIVIFSPLAYTVTGGGFYCNGTSAPSVGLSDSQAGVNYQLLRNGINLGSLISRTGNTISFGVQSQSGNYSVRATNAVTLCSGLMSDTVQVTLNSLPTRFLVNGGGTFCTGTGAPVVLNGSQLDVSYEIYNNGVATGTVASGNGGTINFPLQYTSGTYTVIATNTNTACSDTMDGSASVINLPGPQQFNIVGGGNVCIGSTVAAVGISGSDSGAVYLLYRDTVATGDTLIGTGSPMNFTQLTQSGEYTVIASTSTMCKTPMLGSALFTFKPSPELFNVTGGGTYCISGNSVDIGVDSSQLLVNYRLWIGGLPNGGVVPGTGHALNISSTINPGTYYIVATNTSNACTSTMNGVAVIIVDSFPHIYNVIGGGNFCDGDSGVAVGLDSTQIGVAYSLSWNSFPTGDSLTGAGGPLNFGLIDSAGLYTVVATTTTQCSKDMNGGSTISINPLHLYNHNGLLWHLLLLLKDKEYLLKFRYH